MNRSSQSFMYIPCGNGCEEWNTRSLIMLSGYGSRAPRRARASTATRADLLGQPGPSDQHSTGNVRSRTRAAFEARNASRASTGQQQLQSDRQGRRGNNIIIARLDSQTAELNRGTDGAENNQVHLFCHLSSSETMSRKIAI